jgi:hypothetical protein
MNLVTYNAEDLKEMNAGKGELSGALVFYRVDDANLFSHLVRTLRSRAVDVRAKGEQIPVRVEGDGEKNVYRVEFGYFFNNHGEGSKEQQGLPVG